MKITLIYGETTRKMQKNIDKILVDLFATFELYETRIVSFRETTFFDRKDAVSFHAVRPPRFETFKSSFTK